MLKYMLTNYFFYILIICSILIFCPSSNADLHEIEDGEARIYDLLERIDPEFIHSAEDLSVAMEAIDELGNYADHPVIIPGLINALKTENFHERILMHPAARLIANIGEPAKPALMEAINDDELIEGVIFTFRIFDNYYPEVSDHVIKTLHTATAPSLLCECLYYIKTWGDNGYNLTGDIAFFVNHNDSLVRNAACDVASSLNYRDNLIFYAMLDNYLRNRDNSNITNTLENMAKLSPTSNEVDEILLASFDSIEDDGEKIWVACILYINDTSRENLLDLIISHLDGDYATISHALHAIRIIGEPAAARAEERLLELLEDPYKNHWKIIIDILHSIYYN